MKRNRKHPSVPPRRQRGVATLLIVLVVGLAVSVTVAATVYSLRGTQAKQLTTHSATAAQAAAWRGVEALRLYLLQLNKIELAGLSGPVEGMGALGVKSAAIVGVTPSGIDRFRVNATVTGQAGVGSALTTATVEVIYEVGPGGEAVVPPVCGAMSKASTVLRGDVSITGGETGFVSNEHYEDIAVDGSLTIQSASQAIISGCAKGDITLSGGGIDDNAWLRSQNGTITIKGMSPPVNAKVWARNVRIEQDQGTYDTIWAGAYNVNVVADGNIVGSAYAGGRLIQGTAGGMPWATGTVKPAATGKLLITLTDGGEWLLDMGAVTIDAASGAVSNARLHVEKVNDSGNAVSETFPDGFTLVSTAISGGELWVQRLDLNRQMWGYNVTINNSYGGRYPEILAAGNFTVGGTPPIGKLVGGGFLWSTTGGCSSPTNCWNFPTFGSSNNPIAGEIFYGTNKTPKAGGLGTLVAANQAGTSPGLPGAPFCDTRSYRFDADSFRSAANFIFEFEDGKPILTIQNMNAQDGTAINRAKIDLTTVDPVPATSPANMTLRRIGGEDFLGCGNQAPDNQHADALSCLRNATPATGWVLTGITKFPPGIVLFKGRVVLNGINNDTQPVLANTLLSTGGVEIGSNGVKLTAPNFVNPVSNVCGGRFYPANLCEGTNELKKWTDAEGRERSGLPIANLAIGTDRDLDAGAGNGNITGNVILGRGVRTGGATLFIGGSLTVGANERSQTAITGGGLKMDTSKITSDQGYLPGVCTVPESPTSPGPASASVLWSRYL